MNHATFSYNAQGASYRTTSSPRYIVSPATDLPYQVRGVGISGNGLWMILALRDTYVRFDLSNSRVVEFGEIPENESDAVFTPAISNDGNYVAITGGDFWKLLVYDLIYCGGGYEREITIFPNCDYTQIHDSSLKGSYPSNALSSQAECRYDLTS